MAEKTSIPRLNMRRGLILTCGDVGKQIKNINVPELDPKYFIFKAEDITGENSLNFGGSVMPIMATDSVMYKEQPLLAIIAPDFESAEIARRAIKVETGEDIELSSDGTYQEDYGWGSIDEFRSGWKEIIKREKKKETKEVKAEEEEKKEEVESTPSEEQKEESAEVATPPSEEAKEEAEEEIEYEEEVILHPYKKIESTFSLNELEYESNTYFLSTCFVEGNTLHVFIPTQYPSLISETISRFTGFEKKKISVHPQPYSEVCDEYLIYPAIVSAITASAAIALKCPVEIKSRSYNRRSPIRTKRITYLSDEMKIVAEEVQHQIDIGAFAMLEREVQREAMTALIPSYGLQAFKASIKIKKSFNFPSFMFLGLGYPEALASTEYHSNILAKAIGMNPYEFRLYAYKEKRKFTDYLPAVSLQEIKKLLTDTAMKSQYSRKWSSNDLGESNSEFLGYTKGIGIASGIGISGFSTSFSAEHDYKAKITYTQRGAIVIDTSAYSKGTAHSFWKRIVKNEIGLASEDSVIFSSSDHSTMDSGPKVLSRFMCSFSKQLRSAARKLKGLKETEKLPIALTFDTDNKFFPCEFDESAYASAAIEVILPETSLHPTIKEVWLNISVAEVADTAILLAHMKTLIVQTLREAGVPVDRRTKINISIARRDAESIAAVASITRALITASLASALEQAIGSRVTLPISAEDILHLRRGISEN